MANKTRYLHRVVWVWLGLVLPLKAAETFTVAIYYPQVPPYMYAAADNMPRGVIPDLLNAFFQQQPYEVKYVYENRFRAELGLYNGEYDASVLAAAWTKQPEQLLFSQPIIQHIDYYYSLTPFVDNAEARSSKTICLRRHYVYGAIDAALQSGALIRVDAESEFDQLNMLVNGRCQQAYINEHVATWLINNHFADINLYRQPETSDKTDLTLALHPKWQKLTPKLDAFIREAHRSGFIDRALAKHMQKR